MRPLIARRWGLRATLAVVFVLSALVVTEIGAFGIPAARGVACAQAGAVIASGACSFKLPGATGGPAVAASPSDTPLLAEAEARQVIQFNPNASLQQRIFADGFVPNSSEFSLDVGGTPYTAQRAENLRTGEVRVYYVANGAWSEVRRITRGTEAGSATTGVLLQAGEKRQVIQFNPGASLQRRIFADGFVPNSSEFTLDVGGTAYTAQRAENLKNGQVRVYYVGAGDWSHVRTAGRGVAGSSALTLTPLAEDANSVTIAQTGLNMSVLKHLPAQPAELGAEVERHVDEATVQLVVSSAASVGIGTGTVVGNGGHTLLTAFHVVGDLQTGQIHDPIMITVGPYMNYTLHATVVAASPENDLALLRIEPMDGFGGFNHLELADTNACQLGEAVYVYGYPARREGGLARSTGSLLAVGSNARDGVRRVFMTDGLASPGSSGGVVVNARGEVMGIISAGVPLPSDIARAGLPPLTRLTAYTPSGLARALLRQAGVQ